VVVADLNEVSLEQAWKNRQMKILRTWFLKDEIPENCKCYNCINNSNNDVRKITEIID
jgi:hypothetical protein